MKKSLLIFGILLLISILVNSTYYFDHRAVSDATTIFNEEIYKDKTNLYYLINSNTPSFLFVIINSFIQTGFSVNFVNSLLTLIPIFLNLTGIYLVCRFITSSVSLSILISLTAILLEKNFGHIDYPVMMFSVHTNGLFSLSLCTFILGLLTLRKLLFAYLTSLFLLSVHLTMGLWMFGIIVLCSSIYINKKNIKTIGIVIFFLLLVSFFYINWFNNFSPNLPYEFSQKDYDDYFYYVESHRTNFGDLGNINFNYILKTIIFLLTIFFYIKFYPSNIKNHNNFFFKTLIISTIFSGLIYLTYKIYPQIFPDFIIRVIPQRFFIIHAIVGYPIIISIIFKFLEKFLIYKNFKKNFATQIIIVIIFFHLGQQHETIFKRINNIEIINNQKIEENNFWRKAKNLSVNGYVLTSNSLCHKTLTYGNLPILYCFRNMDYVPMIPKLASPIQNLLKKVFEIPYSGIVEKSRGGLKDPQIKTIYQNKSLEEWNILKKDLGIDIIIVPKNWKLNLNLILDDKYKVFKIN